MILSNLIPGPRKWRGGRAERLYRPFRPKDAISRLRLFERISSQYTRGERSIRSLKLSPPFMRGNSVNTPGNGAERVRRGCTASLRDSVVGLYTDLVQNHRASWACAEQCGRAYTLSKALSSINLTSKTSWVSARCRDHLESLSSNLRAQIGPSAVAYHSISMEGAIDPYQAWSSGDQLACLFGPGRWADLEIREANS